MPYACDIADPAQADSLVETVTERHPDLNAFLLNAGITHTYRLFGTEDAIAHAEAEMTTHYLSTVRLTHRLQPVLEGRSDATMIITTSGAALVSDIRNPTHSAMKAALHSLCQCMRLTLERRGSNVRIVELMAPLMDSPFSSAVTSRGKVPPADVAAVLLDGLEADDPEIRPASSERLYRLALESPDEALKAINALTGGA